MTLTIAHRGEPVGHVENTLEALEAAVAAGADMLEIDVRLTADGVPVLLHDADLTRIWGEPRRLSELASTELARLRPVGGSRIPTLADAADLAQSAGVQLMVDLPEPAAGPVAAELLIRLGCADLALYAGFTAPVRARSSTARIALTWDSLELPGQQLLDSLRPEFFNPYFQLLTASVADRMHERGMLVSVWTVDHPRDMAAVIIQGADAVTTNHIEDLVSLVGTRAPVAR
ncbi:glycerophosphodiester phosphodiesterase [Nakamurella sp. PAMC28650]|uniref:glycerophosphodiester phosphodiesterase n=1 Tax=Nakamurella sp. PAMC28650 TaxID=2762325 RepID=UPI00164E7A44|nr:glycerophosphodiester phosphodiesterase [Nakamurella sp. PAMC28650]QNK81060.1 glycerophosphodiester phosphodiesterase [Nakamurella sp. PAMC28650]